MWPLQASGHRDRGECIWHTDTALSHASFSYAAKPNAAKPNAAWTVAMFCV